MKNIRITPEFKDRTTRAILSILLFIVIYIVMLILAIGLTVISVYGGIMLIAMRPSLFTMAFGIGLASLGILVLFFLLKFIFNKNKIDRSNLIEIYQTDEPKLFQLIDEIVLAVGTNFPKKVYLSSNVNAAVFYDSSFWSMFFPVKKNLQIGLGLVNSVTQSELKAILSHEFGHFSQKTMKVGSYVYNVNQVIFNLVYHNESFDNLLQKWANASGYFAIFVVLAFRIIAGIQWILKQIYDIVNKNYMALSREMEFQADEIAAHVTGYEPLKQSLIRLSFADHAFNTVLSFYEEKISENQKSENLFKDHLFVTNFLASEFDIKIVNNFPQISQNDLNKFNKSKLVIKDQWASHPSTEDRIEMLEKTGLSQSNLNNEPANLLFSDIERIQRILTNKIFGDVQFSGENIALPLEKFEVSFKENYLKNSFAKEYNGYYDNKNPLYFDIQNINNYSEPVQFDDLFSEAKVSEIYSLISLQSDIESIKQISNNTIEVKTFDYDGIKYSKNDCKNLLIKLEKELEQLTENIKKNDILIFKYFKALEQKSKVNPSLEDLYKEFFDYDKDFDSKYEIYIQLSNDLDFINYTTPIEQIKSNFTKIETLEQSLKNKISEILESQSFQSELTKEIKENFELYLSQNWQYFGKESYFDKNLEVLFGAMNNYAFLLTRGYFIIKQKLLNHQIELLSHRK